MAIKNGTSKEIDQALEFAESLRGHYIIGQALHYAIKELEKVPSPYREVSSISDMKYLRDELYNFPDELYTVPSEVTEQWQK